MHESHQEEHSKEWGIKSKTIARFMDKGLGLGPAIVIASAVKSPWLYD